jgi:hypothetical protein
MNSGPVVGHGNLDDLSVRVVGKRQNGISDVVGNFYFEVVPALRMRNSSIPATGFGNHLKRSGKQVTALPVTIPGNVHFYYGVR